MHFRKINFFYHLSWCDARFGEHEAPLQLQLDGLQIKATAGYLGIESMYQSVYAATVCS